MKIKPRILIINIHSSKNAGDLALLETGLQQLKTTFSFPEFVLSVNCPDEPYFDQSPHKVVPSPWTLAGTTARRPLFAQFWNLFLSFFALFCYRVGLRAFSRSVFRGWYELFEAYQTADLVVGIAGNQFYSTGKYGWPFPVTAMSVWLAHVFSKPHYTMPQSLGPLKRNWERNLLSALYRRSRLVLVRDEESFNLCRQIGIPESKIKLIPDPAFNLSAESPEKGLQILSRYGYSSEQNSIGATVIAKLGYTFRNSITNYYEVLAQAFEYMIRTWDVTVYLFIQVNGPTEFETDSYGARQVIRLIPKELHPRIKIVDEAVGPGLLKSCYGHMRLFIPTRLHSGIFALSQYVPCLFVGYLTKTRGILNTIGLSDWYVEIDQLSYPKFVKKLEAFWLTRAEKKRHLEAVMPEVIRACDSSAAILLEDFQSHAAS